MTLSAESKIQKVIIYFMDPMDSTGTTLSCDAIVSTARQADNSPVSYIEIEGEQPLAFLQTILANELKYFPSNYWLINSLDARIVFRFYIDKEHYLQLTCQNESAAQWNNLSIDPPDEKKLKQIFSLLPKVLYDRVYNPLP